MEENTFFFSPLWVSARRLDGSAPHPWSHGDCQINRGSIRATVQPRSTKLTRQLEHTSPPGRTRPPRRCHTNTTKNKKNHLEERFPQLHMMEGGSGYSHRGSPCLEAWWWIKCGIMSSRGLKETKCVDTTGREGASWGGLGGLSDCALHLEPTTCEACSPPELELMHRLLDDTVDPIENPCHRYQNTDKSVSPSCATVRQDGWRRHLLSFHPGAPPKKNPE